MGLVEELVDQTQPEPGRLARIAQDVASRWARGDAIIDDRGLLGLFATPEQSEVMGRVQALMTVLEGHGHVVMDRVGAENLKSQARMSRVLKARRLDRRTAAFFRLTGLEMKMKQYQMGERFIKHVEREAGWSAVSLLYRGAGSLPTLAEIEQPGAWLARVA
jgi:putative hydrolase